MLAKPEYFSPPDEVCCWPGGAAAESHREDIAGRGRCCGEPSGRYCWPGRCGGEPSGRCCWPKRCGRDGAKWKSERKSLPLRRRRCNATDAQKTLRCSRCTEDAAMQQMRRSRCDATDAQKPLRCSRCTEAAPLGARKKGRASTDRWHRKSNPAQRLVPPMPAAQEK